MRRHVVQMSAAGQGRTERCAITQVAMDLLDRQTGQVAEVGPLAGEDAHLDSGLDQGAGHGSADESGCAGDEGFHWKQSFMGAGCRIMRLRGKRWGR